MQYRKLITNVICPQCESVVEMIDDLFRECPVSVTVWTELSFQKLLRESNMEFLQWLT
ncbi:hypothetical protein Goshw_025017 [Gossypium schwendimanii]|uniref:Reverse transcriptase zinc-binding domain-containing protein n=1 Tax=Gossypium schwendimanii TaxID=34291 RepID=A0A7J9NFS7_GOSSC|nr:hypothetical protein [Gossypium schwendimanii]